MAHTSFDCCVFVCVSRLGARERFTQTHTDTHSLILTETYTKRHTDTHKDRRKGVKSLPADSRHGEARSLQKCDHCIDKGLPEGDICYVCVCG